MHLARIPRLLAALLALLAGAAAAAAQAPAAKTGGKLIPGARLLHKWPKEVYRVPELQSTAQGPRLLVWVDAADPNPRTIPGIPAPKVPFELFVVDPLTGKKLHKLSSASPETPESVVSPLGPPTSMTYCSMLTLSPDGKELANISRTYRVIPGKPVHEVTQVIKAYDFATKRWKKAIPTSYNNDTGGPSFLYTPDGSLVVLKDASGTVWEAGKAEPRLKFEVPRATNFARDGILQFFGIRDAAVSPDGYQLAVAVDGFLPVYDLKTGKEIFRAERAVPEDDPLRRQVGQGGRETVSAALVFVPGGDAPKLLAVEVVVGPPKSLVLARLFDVAAKKEIGRWTVAEHNTRGGLNGSYPQWGQPCAFVTSKGEPRFVFGGKLFDGSTGKVLHKFNEGVRVFVSRDGKCLIRVTRRQGEEKRMGIEMWGLDNGT
jgi:hypothetical protein